MSIIKILEDSKRKEFDKPPKFSYPQRKIMFSLPPWGEMEYSILQNVNTKVGLIMQIGYFKASNRFFKIENFIKDDFMYILRAYKLSIIEFDVFKEAYIFSLYPHRQIILKNFGIKSYGEPQKRLLYQETTRLLKKQVNPQSIFFSMASYLRSHKIEVPTYFALATILTKSLRERDVILADIIESQLKSDTKDLFDKMLSVDEDSNEKKYFLTQLKKAKEVMKPSAIRANIVDYKALKDHYVQIKDLLPLLDISDEMIQYYAHFVIKAQVFQVVRRENKYLMLFCFIVYQYRILGDILVDTFLKATQQFENVAQRESKESVY